MSVPLGVLLLERGTWWITPEKLGQPLELAVSLRSSHSAAGVLPKKSARLAHASRRDPAQSPEHVSEATASGAFLAGRFELDANDDDGLEDDRSRAYDRRGSITTAPAEGVEPGGVALHVYGTAGGIVFPDQEG